ncbi:MAG: DUF4175 family protein [Pacificibacter sp.]|uniref:DUF4175 domain-containing protein n=1 Tax=Pacificibacter sp. TaxID=1917866 RepID=UPI003219FA34
MNKDTSAARSLARHIKRTVGLTFVGLCLERFVQAFLWFGVLICLAITGYLFGAFSISPVLVWIALVALGVAFVMGALRFRLPTWDEAQSRVDASLPNRPLQALNDLNATGQGDAETQEVWRAHQARMAVQAMAARAIAPNVRLSKRDPYALRLIAVTSLIMAFLFGADAPQLGSGSGNITDEIVAGPAWEGWIEPPAHTGKPTLYLADLPAAFTAPKESKVTIRLYGDGTDLTLSQSVSDTATSDADLAQGFKLERDGEIKISGSTGRIWDVALLPDSAPTAELLGEMTRAASGELRQSYRVSDDFGVARSLLDISLDRDAVVSQYGYQTEPEPRDDLSIAITLPRARDRQNVEGMVVENLSRHPFSGLPVRVNLTAWDTVGQKSTVAQSQAILPGRKFFDPLAAALIDVRRELLWSRMNAQRSAQVLRAISYAQDEEYGGDQALFLRLRSVAGLIEVRGSDMSGEVWDSVTNTLWDIAVELEDGELSEALERLRRAQERLSQAMRDGATPEEIAKLMQELREATRDYIRQRAEQQDQDQSDSTAGDTEDISADQLQKLMDRIQELMEQGRMAEAQQLMDMLNALLENMQVTRGQGAGGDAMEGLQDMLREQQELNDQTFSDLQNQFGTQPNEDADAPEGADGLLADRQQALRDQLQREQDGLPRSAPSQDGDAASELERAERSMEEAEKDLRNNDFAGALDNQARAMDALRKGLKSLGEELSGQSQDENSEGSQAQSGTAEGQDPLGRSDDGQGAGNLGQDGLEDQLSVRKQAEELMNEIRRRSAQRERADEELEYLNRLLDRF